MTDSAGTGWTDRTARLRRQIRVLLEEIDFEAQADRALFAKDVPSAVVHLNRVFQSLADHLSDVADGNAIAWREDVVTVLIPVEQRGEERVKVPTGDGETAVVPVTTTTGGVAWTEESLSLADLDRWRDRTFTRQSKAAGRSRGVDVEAEQVFLPPAAIRTAMDQVDRVLAELDERLDVDLDLPADVDPDVDPAVDRGSDTDGDPAGEP
ncbi:MAG: hypothetical protein ABEJ42_00510 [Halobacteriaceae archaeon]